MKELEGKDWTAEDEQYDILKALKAEKEEQMKKHKEEMNNLVRCFTKKRANTKRVRKLLKKHEQEMKYVDDPEEKEDLEEKHDKEINELIQELINKSNDDCHIFQSIVKARPDLPVSNTSAHTESQQTLDRFS